MMTISATIYEHALVALLKLEPGQHAVLTGIQDSSRIVVLSAAFCGKDDIDAIRDVINSLLPAPLRVIGVYCSGESDLAVIRKCLWPGSIAAVASGSDLRVYVEGSQSGLTASVLPEASSTLGISDVLNSAYVPLRCTANLVLEILSPGASTAAAADRKSHSVQLPTHSLQHAIEELEQDVCGASTLFLAETSAAEGQPAKAFIPDGSCVGAVGGGWGAPLHLKPYTSASSPHELSVPSVAFDPVKGTMLCAALHLDVLCYAPKDMPAQQAVEDVVRPAVRSQLRTMHQELSQRQEVTPLRALHFRPPGLPHHITLVYPLPTPSIESDEETLLPLRTQLHSMLGLPTNRPLLRVANAVEFGTAGKAGRGASGTGGSTRAAGGGGVGGKPRLADVHLGLAASSVGGSVHLIQGTYDYYHYMQDKFDDCGWGCAYRSLQTICSWFAKQLYTSRPVPSHREIQQTLVSIGDKQHGFIGSRQWIGAIELGFVLDTLLGVTCKVITVASGAEMPSKAREIAHHFDTQGTPIMIGGGVLAYTLLGIDFNERTGDCAFLILDPHYTGPEDLRRVRSGQWVAWKKLGDKAAAGGDLFVNDAFYNLLCPQRPNTV